MSAAGVKVSIASVQGAGRGSNPTAALHSLYVQPLSFVAAKRMIEKHHYLHSLPGGTVLAFGIVSGGRLSGAITFGVGPLHGYRLVRDTKPEDCVTLTRLWLSDELPANSESRVIGISLRAIKKHTGVKFVLSYADPAQGHIGTIYQATGWLYTGLSEAMPMVDLGDGTARHSRTLAHSLGTHSLSFMRDKGLAVKIIPQSPKYRYVYFLDQSYRARLAVPVLPYPKKASCDVKVCEKNKFPCTPTNKQRAEDGSY